LRQGCAADPQRKVEPRLERSAPQLVVQPKADAGVGRRCEAIAGNEVPVGEGAVRKRGQGDAVEQPARGPSRQGIFELDGGAERLGCAQPVVKASKPCATGRVIVEAPAGQD
jgi:hypothetical protein